MASAVKQTVQEEVITKVLVDKKVIHLALEEQEVETLRYILASIAGSPANTRRMHTERISRALDEVGIYTNPGVGKYKDGNIMFLKEENLV